MSRTVSASSSTMSSVGIVMHSRRASAGSAIVKTCLRLRPGSADNRRPQAGRSHHRDAQPEPGAPPWRFGRHPRLEDAGQTGPAQYRGQNPATVMRTASPAGLAPDSQTPPLGIASMALLTRFSSAISSSSRAPRIGGRPSAHVLLEANAARHQPRADQIGDRLEQRAAIDRRTPARAAAQCSSRPRTASATRPICSCTRRSRRSRSGSGQAATAAPERGRRSDSAACRPGAPRSPRSVPRRPSARLRPARRAARASLVVSMRSAWLRSSAAGDVEHAFLERAVEVGELIEHLVEAASRAPPSRRIAHDGRASRAVAAAGARHRVAQRGNRAIDQAAQQLVEHSVSTTMAIGTSQSETMRPRVRSCDDRHERHRHDDGRRRPAGWRRLQCQARAAHHRPASPAHPRSACRRASASAASDSRDVVLAMMTGRSPSSRTIEMARTWGTDCANSWSPESSSDSTRRARAQLEVVDDRLGGHEAGLAQVSIGGLFEQANLEQRLDAEHDGDDERDTEHRVGCAATSSWRSRPYSVRLASALRSAPARTPAANRRRPAAAIIAALSVESARLGM